MSGDQPEAVEKLVRDLKARGCADSAWSYRQRKDLYDGNVIQRLQRPTCHGAQQDAGCRSSAVSSEFSLRTRSIILSAITTITSLRPTCRLRIFI